MSETHDGLEVIDLCSSDESSSSSSDHEEEAEESGGTRVSLDRMDGSQNANNGARTVSASAVDDEVSSAMPSRKRAAEIDLTGDDTNDDDDDSDTVTMSQSKKFRGGGQGSSRSTPNEMQDHPTVSSAASSSSSSTSPAAGSTSGSASTAASTTDSLSSIRIVLEKDGRVKDTGVLQEGMMDLLYRLNQASFPVAAKLCTRHGLSASVTNPYVSSSSNASNNNNDDNRYKRSQTPSTVRWIEQKDNWSCGYRSLQMILTALLPRLPTHHAYYQVVPRRGSYVAIPSLGQIQSTLEQAWKEGYDPQGARHFGQRILGKTGKSGELGAMEVSSVMTYWGLDTTVVQFVTCPQSRRLLPIFVKSYFAKALGKEDCPCCHGGGGNSSMTSVDNRGVPSSLTVGVGTGNDALDSAGMANKLLQFAEASLAIEETCDCPVLPLYLQWEGHAVIIVGYHERNGRLVVFDPRKKIPPIASSSHQTRNPPKLIWSTLFQMDPGYLRNRDTQIIIASYQSLSPTKKESRRQQLEVVTAAEEDVLRAVAASRS